MRLEELLNCWSGRGSRMRSRSRYPYVERLEGRAVPASYTAASVTDLVAAINAANATAGADTITLAAGKTFTLTAVGQHRRRPHGAAGRRGRRGPDDRRQRRRHRAEHGRRHARLPPARRGRRGVAQAPEPHPPGGLALGVLGSGDARMVARRGRLQPGHAGPQRRHGPGQYGPGSRRRPAVVADTGRRGGRRRPVLRGWADPRGQHPPRQPRRRRSRRPRGLHRRRSRVRISRRPGRRRAGGGLYVGGGASGINNSAFTANTARGGDGGDGAGLPKGVDNLNPTAGGDGGDGSGGAIYAAAGSVAVRNTEITSKPRPGGRGRGGRCTGLAARPGRRERAGRREAPCTSSTRTPPSASMILR